MEYKLDLKDKKLLYELDKDSRQNLTKLAKKLKLSKEVIYYRIKNLLDKNIILKFHTVPATYRFGQTAYKVYLKLHDISKIKYEELIEFLIKDKEIFWIGKCHGRWDLIFGIWANNIEEFFKAHDKVLEKFSKFIQEKELSISRENIQYNRRWFYNEESSPKEFNFGEKEEKIKLDEFDKKIIQSILNNSRKKIVEIAYETKLSVDQVAYRLKKMENDKIIKGYKCLFNVHKLGFVTTKSFVYFKNINEKKKKEFIDYFKKLSNTINFVITFAPWDLEIMFELESLDKHFEIMEEIKEKFNDLIRFYESVLIYEEPKQVFGK
ncbi:MAG: AsnC family transcriptional regulator [Nanoarchaeota archaeon]|nr:AsnC family transcriptional regulator [Nanoarchaeota archaeon]